MYERDLKSHSYIVQYKNDNELQLGSISYFIKITSCICVRKSCRCNGNHYVVIQKIVTDNILFIQGNNFIYDSNTFLHKCHTTNNIVLLPVNNITTICVLININNQMYVGIPVNQQEFE